MKASNQGKGRPAREISWQQILANLDDGVVTVDLEDKIGYFNEAAEVLTDVSASAAGGQPFEQIFEREPWLIELLKKTQPPRQESARGEGDLRTRRGKRTQIGRAHV